MSITVLVGLGNPGDQYRFTRHNVGFLLLDKLALQLGASFIEKNKFKGLMASVKINQKTIYLLKPLTYMNRSGESLQELLHFYKLSAPHVLLVADDVHQPLGQMRFREKGSAGGHNGLKSIESYLGTQNYSRLRIGVQSTELFGKQDMANYVLGRFNSKELEALETVLEKACEISVKLINDVSFDLVKTEANKRI